MSTSSHPGTPSPSIDRSNSGPVTITASTMSTACTMKPAVEVRTPELAATAGGRPCFWKKRMLSVALPAVPPTRPVNALANCTAVTGPKGSRAETAPSMATDCDSWVSCPMTSVSSTQPQIASLKMSPMAATPAS